MTALHRRRTIALGPRRLRAAALALGLTLGLGATAPASANTDIIIGATQPGSNFFIIGTALTDVISKSSDYTGKLITSAGPAQWLPMMVDREVDLGILSHYEAWLAGQGKPPFEQRHDVRLLAVGSGLNVGLYVLDESPVRSRSEINGLRIASEYAGSPAINVFAAAELANAGLTFDDMQAAPRTTLYGGQREDVTERRLDVFYASVGSGIINELDSTLGLRFLPLDPSPEALARMREVYPVVVSEVKAGPPGVDEDMTLTFLPTYIVAYGAVDESAVHATLGAIWDMNEEFRAANPMLGGWQTDVFVSENAILPYHEHAVSFYKARGAWTDAMQARQDALLAEFAE
jgi:TRAP transporter TAXI family solute receptor